MQPGIMAGRLAGMQVGVMNLALIPLIGIITLDSSYSLANAYIYTIHRSVVIPTNLFIFLHDYSHSECIYTIYILYNPDGLYSNNPPLNPKGC